VITFSTLSGLLGYTFMSINIVKFRRKWPLASINRGYVHPFRPIPALVLAVVCTAMYFATLGYRTSLLSIMAFCIIASIGCALHRYEYMKRGDQFTMWTGRVRRTSDADLPFRTNSVVSGFQVVSASPLALRLSPKPSLRPGSHNRNHALWTDACDPRTRAKRH
jgi:hypothetical protein